MHTPALATAGNYGAEYFPAAAPAGTYAAGLTAIATNEYWNINKASGPDAQVTLLYTGNNTWSVGSPTSMDNIIVAQNIAGVWNAENGSTIPGNTGSGATPVSSKALTSLTTFTFGFSTNTALPVTLIRFEAAKVSDGINLLWSTSSEVSFSRYETERSADGHTFYTLGTVAAATNSSLLKNYSWTDHSPLPGVNFYRLKMIDIDGVFKYSPVAKIDMNAAKRYMAVYPNPVTDYTIMVQMYGQLKGDFIIVLFNNSGEQVMSSRIAHDGNNAGRSIPLNKNISTGFYYLQITDPAKNKKIFKILIN